MKHLLTLILVALSTACGGAEFSGYEVPAGGDDSSAGTGSVTVTGGSGAGGTPAAGGKPSTGGSSSAAGSGTAGGGAGSVTCEFDPAQMMAALPTEIDLGDFSYTSGELCVRCLHEPCRKVPVISWGVPIYDEMYGWLIRPNVDTTMVTLSIGANDGACTMQKQCGTKPDQPQVVLNVKQQGAAWFIASARFSMTFSGNACTNDYASGGYLNDLTKAVDTNVSQSLVGLEIPCGK